MSKTKISNKKAISVNVNKDSIFIKGIKIKTYIGVYALERERKQTVIVNLEVHTNAKKAAAADQITNVLDYQALHASVVKFVTAAKFQLIETLAENVASLVLENFPTNYIKLTITKPAALSPACVSICIERKKKKTTL